MKASKMYMLSTIYSTKFKGSKHLCVSLMTVGAVWQPELCKDSKNLIASNFYFQNHSRVGAVHILRQPLEGGGGGKPKDDDC